MAAERPKRHHYVPRFLLRRFTDDPANERKGRLFRLDKATGKPEKASILNEALIGHYYTVTREGEDGELEHDVTVEQDLAEREGAAAGCVRALVKPGGRLTDEERRQFAEFIHLTRKRTPLERAWAAHMSEVISDQWRDIYKEEPTGLAETLHEQELETMYMALEQAAEMLDSFTWTLLRAPASRRFIIGDTPIAVSDLTLPPHLGLGYGSSAATETTFPLDPSSCLHIQFGDETWIEREATPAEVDDLNLRSYAWAQHSIYGSNQATVTSVRALAKANPTKLGQYAPRSGKVWFGQDIAGRQVWDGFSATEAGIKPNVRR